jgi:hypothetical protein
VRGAVPLIALLIAACGSFAVYEQQESDTLYFGTNKVHGGVVSDAEWQQFLRDVVTPRFPGFTHWKAEGEWMNQAEETHILVIVHPKGHETAIREIVSEGKRRLDQQEVLLVREDVWLPMSSR